MFFNSWLLLQAIYTALEEKLSARALVLALRLNEPKLIRKCIESVPPEEITTVVSSIPVNYLVTLCTALGEYIVNSVHLEFLLLWCQVGYFISLLLFVRANCRT